MSKINDGLKNQDVDYEKILNNLNIGFYKGKFQGELLKHNVAFNKIFGCDPNENLIGTKASQFLIYPNERETYYTELIENGFVKNLNLNIKDKNGVFKVVQLNSRLIRNEKGEPIAVEGTFKDITEKYETLQKIKEFKELYRLIAECAKDVIFTLDLNMKFTYISPSIYELLGYTSDEMMNNTVNKYNTPSSLKIIANALKEEFKIEKMNIKVLNRIRTLEVQQIHKNGSIIDVEIISTFLRDDDGKATGIFGVSRDISKRKKIEKKLIESEKKYRTLITNILDEVLETDLDGTITYVSPQVFDLLGYSPDEVIGTNSLAYTHPDDLNSVAEALKTTLKTNKEVLLEFRLRHKDGHYITVSARGNFIKEGDNAKLVAILRDITERKKAEQKVKESEETFRTITEQSLVGIAILQDGQVKYVNERLLELTGFTIDEIKGWDSQGFAKVIHPEDREFVVEQAMKKETGLKDVVNRYEMRIIKKKGDILWCDNYSKTITYNGRLADLAILVDISRQKDLINECEDSEEKYRKISERYEMLLESITDAIFVINSDWEYTLVNKLAEKIVNMPIENLLGQKITDVFPGIEKTSFYKTYETVMNRRKSSRIRDIFILPDGSTGYYEVSVYPISEGILCIGKNVTKDEEAKQKLKDSEEKYRDLYEHAPNAYFSISSNKNIIRCNKASEKLLGYSKEEFLNLNIFDLYVDTESSLLKGQELFKRFLGGQQFKDEELQMKHKNGNLIWVSLSVEPILDNDGNVLESRSMVIDISERKRIEHLSKEKEEQLRYQAMLVEKVHDAIISTDINFNIISWNNVAKEIYGWKARETIGKNIEEIIPVKYINDEEETVIKEFFKNGYWRGEVIQYHRDGSPIYIDSSVSIIKDLNGNQIGVVAINRDISEHKKYEKLIEDIAKFPSENPNPVFRVNKDKILYTNEAGQRFFNLNEGSKIPSMLQEFITNSINSNLRNSLEVELNNRMYLFRITPIQEEGYANIYGRDITERKISEEALKTEKEFTDNVLNASIDTIFVFEPETSRAVRWNKAFRDISGYTDDEIASLKAPDSYYSIEDLKRAAEATQLILTEGESTVEMSLITKDGRSFPFEYTAKAFKSLDGELLVVAVGRYIAERKKSEEVLKESENRYRKAYNRANFYKELIAHDMNNLLQSIHSSVELHKLSQEKPDLFKDKKDFLSTITENIFRGSQLASNVIKLSELEELRIPLKLVNVNKSMREALVFIHKIYQTRNLNINLETLKEEHFVLANDLILDLFENILLNSVKHNINLEIEIHTNVSEVELDNKKYCKIEFIDNAVGIPDERKASIFHRREKNGTSTKGMGIGLSLVKQIVDSFNGKIWVENRVKEDHTKGSKFIVLIPKTT